GRGEHRRLGVAVAVLLPELDDGVPRLRRLRVDRVVHRVQRADLVIGRLVLAHDALVRVRVAGVPGVRADDPGDLGGTLVGGTGEQGGDRGRERPAPVGVVAVARRHEQRTEVGVTDAELAVVDGRLTD